MEQLFDKNAKKRPYHIFQTLLYATLMEKQTDKTIIPALFYIQKAASPDYSPTINLDKKVVEDFASVRDTYIDFLNPLLEEVFSENTNFTQTTVTHNCKYCEFAHICGRKNMA